MTAHENEEEASDHDAQNNAQSVEAIKADKSRETEEPDDTSTPDTVPRSQYEELLGRLGALERKITKVDDSFHNKDLGSDDDQYPDDIEGPWLDHRALHDIRFMIRSARSSRKIYKANLASMEAAERARNAGTISHLMTDGDQGLSAAQLVSKGIKVRPEYSHWRVFQDKTYRRFNAKPLLEPIHVLVGEPMINRSLDFNGQVSAEEVEIDSLSVDSLNARLPERIQICSFPLLWLLEKTCGVLIGKTANGAVFLRPFKLLVFFEQELRKVQSNIRKSIDTRIQSHASVLPWDWEEDLQINDKGDKKTAEKGLLEKYRARISAQRATNADNLHDDLLRDSAALLQLDCLFDFFDASIRPKLHQIEENNDQEEIEFDDLWHLFKPGDLVLEQGEKQAYRLIQVITPAHRGTSPWARWFKDYDSSDSDSDSDDESDGDPLRLDCVFLDYDGLQFGPVSISFRVPRYEGKKPIKSLPVYGLRFSSNQTIRQKLIQRGQMLIDVAAYKSMYYTGFSLDGSEEIDSQVVVDFAEALSIPENEGWKPNISPASTGNKRRTRPSCMQDCCRGRSVHNDDHIDRNLVETFMQKLMPQQTDRPPLTIHPRPWAEMVRDEYTPSDDELLIMTYRVFAFVLRSRKWAQLDLTHLKYDNEETRKSIESSFKRLVLPDGHKEMVQALVTQHFHGRAIMPVGGSQPDLIRGKGKGLIVLLHGAPGVGKTTTAEGVAEEFKRPLFQITCGDLGTTPIEVQAELEKNFSLASRWGCVLLLDEADVFLAQRERKDLTRNALVAIFLRILEYYSGILFLTTNRVGDFDEAFASRIHMSLHYPALDAVKTKKVFELNLDLIKDRMIQQDRPFTIDEDAILDFAEVHYKEHRYGRWNGRQIRNACQTALALAEFESEKNSVFLKPRHFKKVQEAYLDFSRYLGQTFGTQGDQRASDYQWRAEEPDPLTESEASIARSERNTRSPRTRPSTFRPTAQQQAAPMQPSRPVYATYPGMQVPQEGQYFPSNHPPRAPTSQMGPNDPRQYGHQGQTWTGQPPMNQQPGQYPYQQPPPSQPSYQQGFVMQSHDQTGDSGIDHGNNPGTRPVNF